MGYDEHGPAYPEPPYRCPICNGNENRYMVCEYPGCPDGRDAGHPHSRHFDRAMIRVTPVPDRDTTPSRARILLGWIFAIAMFFVWMLWPR